MMVILVAFGIIAVLISATLILGACMASARMSRTEDWLEEQPLRAETQTSIPIQRTRTVRPS